MRRFLLLLGLVPSLAWATPSILSGFPVSNAAAAASLTTATFNTGGAAALIVAFAASDGGSPPFSFSDSGITKTTGWTIIGSTGTTSGSTITAAYCITSGISSGSPQSATASGMNGGIASMVSVYALSGYNTSTPIGNTNTLDSTSSTTMDVTLTSAATSLNLFGFFDTNGTPTNSAQTGSTIDYTSTSLGDLFFAGHATGGSSPIGGTGTDAYVGGYGLEVKAAAVAASVTLLPFGIGL